MEPQARRDKALINKCIDGLEIYAAQQAQAGKNQKVGEMRELVENLACYWGLIEGENAKPLENYLASFDSLITDAKTGVGFTGETVRNRGNTMYGLFRYGTEMVAAQGSDAVFDILHISNLMKEIAASWDFESDVLDNMTGQLEAEVQKMAGRDKALINECIVGLGHYAAQQVRDNYFSSKPEEIRGLIENLVSYWGLEDGIGENTPTLDDILDKFDEQIHAAKHNKEVGFVSSEYEVGAIFGLYRYGEDLAANLGSDAMSEILDMGDWMKEIARYWDFKPYDAVAGLSDRLRAEVRTMLDGVTLPGQPVSGESNVGYQIRQAILFNNDRGFVLAHHPKAPAPYVTWTFTDRDNGRGYDVGYYFSTEERVKLDYMSRVTYYMEAYKVTEKPVSTAAVEVDAEQNYNMIDGVRNNESVPKPDLTDGQTDAEIRELAPEMLPDETAADSQRDAVRVSGDDHPVVTVTFSEHDQLRGIANMPFYLADILFSKLDAMPREERSPDGAPYHKTDFRIDFVRNGEPDSYIGHYDVGDGGGSLIDHIRAVAEYGKNNEGYQQYLSDKGGGELESVNAQLDIVLNELVPYFLTHCKVYEMEKAAQSELADIHDAAEGDPSDSAKVRIEYLEAVVDYSARTRSALNMSGVGALPAPPQAIAAKIAESKPSRDDKPSVLDQIKAARTAPKPSPKPKDERDKKSHGAEL